VEHGLRMTIFWIVHLVLLGLFGIELAFVLSVWLKARVPGLPTDAPRWRKLAAVLLFALRLVLSRRLWMLLRALVADGIVHRRLYHLNLRRWLTHILVFGSWLLLGVISTITGVVVEILPLFGMSPEQVAALPMIGHLFHADVWWVALLNELLGLIVMAGMILVIYRRYVRREPQLRSITADHVIIALLTLIAFTGFPAETFRLLSDYTLPTGAFAPSPAMLPQVLHGVWGPQWGFVGYLSAQVLGLLGLGPSVWEALHNVFFWLHFAMVTALLYYLPFSRFFHVITSPIIVAYNTMLEASGHRGQHRAGHGTPKPAV
jgi:nitrate reductase gamma subunit